MGLPPPCTNFKVNCSISPVTECFLPLESLRTRNAKRAFVAPVMKLIDYKKPMKKTPLLILAATLALPVLLPAQTTIFTDTSKALGAV